jgi:hypothetical protein
MNTYERLMTVEALPPVPTREQELKYLDWLQKSFSEDRIFTRHPKLYGASPFRLHFRNYVETKREYLKTFLKNFVASIALSWPLII